MQSKVGTFLYYGRAVDPSILPALNEISMSQAKPTKHTEKQLEMLMDYLHTYKSAVLRYHAGDMQLAVETDAAYLILPGAKSRIAGHFILNTNRTPNNNFLTSPLHTECKTIRHVVCSAAEAECHGLFHNCQMAVAIRRILNGIGHTQNKTTVKTDNTTVTSFVSSTMKEKKSKTWDMRYNWLRDKPAREKFNIIWSKSSTNMADYFTKNHPPIVHKEKEANIYYTVIA